ncbi:MAG: alpha/beta fold hydrolase, partial [Acidimicrobiales bacterium]
VGAALHRTRCAVHDGCTSEQGMNELPSVRFSHRRGFAQAYWSLSSGHEGAPVLVCVHGWPETKRLYARVAQRFADAGFDVVVPDLRGFGESDVAPDGFNDVVSHALDIHSLVHDELGHRSVVLMGGDLGGPVVQECALRFPGWVERMVVFNSPLPYDRERMAGMVTRADPSTADYFVRQGTEADALTAELDTEDKRVAYVEQFYGSQLGAPGGVHHCRCAVACGTLRRRRETPGLVRQLRVGVLCRQAHRTSPVRQEHPHTHPRAVRHQ